MAIVLVAAMAMNVVAEINQDELASAITQIVSSNCPAIDPTNLAHRSFDIAATVIKGATDASTLEENLKNAFEKSDVMGWETNQACLLQSATKIAIEFAPKLTPPIVPKGASSGSTTNWLVTLSSGAEFLNPYNISVPSGATHGTLVNSGNSTVAYLQFEVMRRGVFAQIEIARRFNQLLGWHYSFTPYKGKLDT